MGEAFRYSTKVWVTSVLLLPLLFIPVGLLIDYKNFYYSGGTLFDTLSVLFAIVIFGLIMSIPAWIMFVFISSAISRLQVNIIGRKLLLAFTLLFELVVTFYAFGINNGTLFPHLLWSALLAVAITTQIIKPPIFVEVVEE